MRPKSKIEQIRNELERLGCTSPVVGQGASAGWSWDGIRLFSFAYGHSRVIDFEVLLEILQALPNDMGEKKLWKQIHGLDLDAIYEDFNRRQEQAFLAMTRREEGKTKKATRKRMVRFNRS